MATERRPMGTITVGGKGSTFSPSSVFLIANNLASVSVDSSALAKLSTPKQPLDLEPYSILAPSNLTHEESRASLAGALSKLLLSSNTTRIRPELPSWISQTLNSGLSLRSDSLEPLHVTKEERAVLDNCLATVDGICALLDHKSSVLCVVADVVGALSSEALRANVSSFGLVDSGDGFCNKDEAAVASGLKDLLNGSKMVGKEDVSDVSAIPWVHGNVRGAARAVHSSVRIELNSGLKGCSSDTNQKWELPINSLAIALKKLGERSLSRADLIVKLLPTESLQLNLRALLAEICPNGESILKAEEQYYKCTCFHLVHELFSCVWKIISWEMVVAIVLLEGPEFFGASQDGAVSTDDANNVKGSNTKSVKKKKKLVPGKGTSSVLQLVKERIQETSLDAFDQSVRLSQGAHCIYAMLDPTDKEFDSLLQKIKEIVESNETRRLPKIPKGTRDFSKEQMAVRERAFAIITRVFKRHGAMALKTPAFEMRETLLGKYGEDSKLIYDLADQGGELCSLRYDLTVPFARHVAMNGITSFKRYQIADVYRRDNPSKGRYREFSQCDFDIAGQFEKMGPDFEIIKILTELLDELNIGDYEVKLNHRKLLDGMLEICGVPSGKFRTICSSIDKLDKLPFEQVKKEMVEEKGLSVETADKIGTFVGNRGSPMELLTKLKQEGSEFLSNEGSKVALEELEILFKALEMSECVNKVVFDLSLARGLDYYTGMIFEAVFKGTTQVGSIAAGGRYDNLIGMFGTKQVPAVGVSLGIERVFAIMEQIRIDQNEVIRANETQVLVSLLFDDLPLAAKLANQLWSADISAEFMMTKRVMKHIDRAKQFRIPFVVFVGERELSEGIVKVKNIESAVEEVVPQNAMVEYLKERLNL